MGKRALDITGNTYGQLTVTGRAARDGSDSYWTCRCTCGAEIVVARSKLNTRTGCNSCTHTTHGHRTGGNSPTYRVWSNMMSRCYNSNVGAYADYGARGIMVHERWHNFGNFLTDMGVRPSGMTIDRIKNELGYSKENCRWATRHTQTINRSMTVLTEGVVQEIWGRYEHKERQYSIAERLGVSRSLVNAVLKERLWRGSKDGYGGVI